MECGEAEERTAPLEETSEQDDRGHEQEAEEEEVGLEKERWSGDGLSTTVGVPQRMYADDPEVDEGISRTKGAEMNRDHREDMKQEECVPARKRACVMREDQDKWSWKVTTAMSGMSSASTLGGTARQANSEGRGGSKRG